MIETVISCQMRSWICLQGCSANLAVKVGLLGLVSGPQEAL